MEKLRQDPQPRSEYGGAQNRRMIGFERNEDMPRGAMQPGHVREYPPVSGYDMHYGQPMGNYPPHMGGYPPEARRHRDSRGRFALGGMEYDDDDEDYSPRGTMGNRPRAHHGNSYGDIYAEGTIYAPGTMNRPMGGMMGGDMSEPVDEHTARMWVQKMDGGEHFKPEQAEQFRAALCPHCDKWEYYVAINAMYSDYCETAKKMGMDKPEFYAHLGRDFLTDKDAGPHKLRKYMMTIPK